MSRLSTKQRRSARWRRDWYADVLRIYSELDPKEWGDVEARWDVAVAAANYAQATVRDTRPPWLGLKVPRGVLS